MVDEIGPLAGTVYIKDSGLKHRLNSLIARRVHWPLELQRKRKLEKALKTSFSATDLYGLTLTEMGIDPTTAGEPVYKATVHGAAADIVRINVPVGDSSHSFILYVAHNSVEDNGNNWVAEAFEGLKRLYQARQERVSDEGKKLLVVPKPFGCGAVQLKGRQQGVMTMEDVSGYTAVFHSINESFEPELVQTPYDGPDRIIEGSYPQQLDQAATMYSLMYRLLDGQFPRYPQFMTGNFMTQIGDNGELSFCVTDVGEKLVTIGNDDEFIMGMHNMIDDPFPPGGELHNFRPFAQTDLEAAVSRADSLLLH